MNTFEIFSFRAIVQVNKATIRWTMEIFFQKETLKLNNYLFQLKIYKPSSQDFPVYPLLHVQ